MSTDQITLKLHFVARVKAEMGALKAKCLARRQKDPYRLCRGPQKRNLVLHFHFQNVANKVPHAAYLWKAKRLDKVGITAREPFIRSHCGLKCVLGDGKKKSPQNKQIVKFAFVSLFRQRKICIPLNKAFAR